MLQNALLHGRRHVKVHFAAYNAHGRTAPQCHGQPPPTTWPGGCPGSETLPPMAPHGTGLRGSGGASLLSLRKWSRKTIIQVKIKVWGVCMQNQSQAWSHGCPCDPCSGVPSLPHLPPSPLFITLDSSTVRLYTQLYHFACLMWMMWNMQDVRTPYLPVPTQMLFVTAAQGCPAAAAFCSDSVQLPQSPRSPSSWQRCPFPYPSLLQRGWSRRPPACLPQLPPCAMCHRPSLRAAPRSLRTCCATAVCLLCCSQAGLYCCARCWCRAPVVTQHPIGGANELRRQRKKLQPCELSLCSAARRVPIWFVWQHQHTEAALKCS